MLRQLFKSEPTKVDEQIDKILLEMNNTPVGSIEYSELMQSLERLYKLKAKESPDRVSRDTMLIVGGNLMGILVIVAYERFHPMTSKALTFIKK